MAKHNELGEKGEFLAANYLEQNGHEIMAKNWRTGKLEIDIISTTKNLIVFVEVKTRTYSDILNPELAVTRKKQRQIIKAANIWIQENNCEMEARFDILTVLITSRGNTINHIESAYYPLVK